MKVFDVLLNYPSLEMASVFMWTFTHDSRMITRTQSQGQTQNQRQIFRIGTVRYAEGLWRMRRHGPVIAIRKTFQPNQILGHQAWLEPKISTCKDTQTQKKTKTKSIMRAWCVCVIYTTLCIPTTAKQSKSTLFESKRSHIR